jgi:hypothetical protein
MTLEEATREMEAIQRHIDIARKFAEIFRCKLIDAANQWDLLEDEAERCKSVVFDDIRIDANLGTISTDLADYSYQIGEFLESRFFGHFDRLQPGACLYKDEA